MDLRRERTICLKLSESKPRLMLWLCIGANVTGQEPRFYLMVFLCVNCFVNQWAITRYIARAS